MEDGMGKMFILSVVNLVIYKILKIILCVRIIYSNSALTLDTDI